MSKYLQIHTLKLDVSTSLKVQTFKSRFPELQVSVTATYAYINADLKNPNICGILIQNISKLEASESSVF